MRVLEQFEDTNCGLVGVVPLGGVVPLVVVPLGAVMPFSGRNKEQRKQFYSLHSASRRIVNVPIKIHVDVV